MIDLHSHTKFSQDSSELPQNHLEAAIKKGCSVLGFSEHLDYDYKVFNLPVEMTDVDAYYKNTMRLKDFYAEKIELLCGIEFAYARAAEGMYRKISAEYGFDYVINSVHVVDGKDCYFPSYFEGKDKDTAYRRYFEEVLQSVYADYDFQIIGHIGYAARNAPYENPLPDFEKLKSLTDDILKAITERGKALEINTNVRTAGSPYLPYYNMVKRYRDLGGKLITFGSDCHQASRVCENYRLVIEMLKEIGFKELAFYRQKKLFTIML